MDKIRKFTGTLPSFIEQMNDLPRYFREAAPKTAAKSTPSPQGAVSIDSDYPSEAALGLMRGLKAPKLKKLTTSLF
ncbi:hypothetical protein [Massilia aurea]|uniref:hypothetical protein n=1 Tax=Massilia aurea TaxID=373040 RepID=UPI0011CDFE4B|nr:hypothetical protein [Massilia aurea]